MHEFYKCSYILTIFCYFILVFSSFFISFLLFLFFLLLSSYFFFLFSLSPFFSQFFPFLFSLGGGSPFPLRTPLILNTIWVERGIFLDYGVNILFIRESGSLFKSEWKRNQIYFTIWLNPMPRGCWCDMLKISIFLSDNEKMK